MTRLFKRVWTLKATTLRAGGAINEIRTWDRLDLSFEIEKTDDQGINEGKIEIIGLSRDSRQFLSQPHTFVELTAGYEDQSDVIFRGEVELCSPERQAPDWVTTLEVRDGAAIARTAKGDKSFKKGTPNVAVFNYLIGLLTKSAAGNIAPLQRGSINLSKVKGVLAKGRSFKDFAYEHLFDLCRSFGLALRVTDFKINITPIKEPLFSEFVRIDKTNGLIGSPEVTEEGVKIKCLKRSDIEPGVVFILESIGVSGLYQAKNVKMVGTTDTGDWGPEVEGIVFSG